MRESTRGVIYIGLDANARVGCDLSRPPPSPNPGGDGTLQKVFPAADGFLRGGGIPYGGGEGALTTHHLC